MSNKKSSKTILDDVLDLLVANPKQTSILLLFGLIGLAIWRRNWLLSKIPFPSKATETVTNWIDQLVMYAAIGLIALVCLFIIRQLIITFRIQRHFTYVQLLPHEDDGASREIIGQLIRRIHGTKRKWITRLIAGREWYSFVVHYDVDDTNGSQYKFYLGAEHSLLQSLEQNFKSIYPQLEFYPADPEFPSKAVGGRMQLKNNNLKKALPLSRYKADQLPGILSHMKPKTWLQVGFSANDGWTFKKAIQELEEDIKEANKASERSTFDKEELTGLKHRYSGNEVAFDCTISLASENYPGVPIIKDVGNAINSIMHDVNELKFKRWKGAVQWYPTKRPYQMTWTGSELANLLHIPHFNDQGAMKRIADSITHTARGEELLPDHVLNDENGVHIGYLHHQFVHDREVRILSSALSKHWALTGVNGYGKSTLINKMLLSFIDRFIEHDQAPGFSFIDPAQDTAIVILNRLLLAEKQGKIVNWDKVHWFSFFETDYPPAMNLLYKMPGESDAFVTDVIMRIIHDNFHSAPQTERLLRNCIQTLVADPDEQHTILGVKQMINDLPFRERILSRIRENPGAGELVNFWKHEAPDLIDQSKIPLFNRLDDFLSNPLLRRMFGQRDFAFNVQRWMDEGHIVFYDFKGLGEKEFGMIGGFLTYLYYRIADRRGDKPLMHQFVVDEAPKVKASIFPYIIREQRKKGLSLGIGTQSLRDVDDDLKDALLEDQGNFFVCKQGLKSAGLSASLFQTPGKQKDVSTYSESYLKTLSSRVVAVRTEDHINGINETVQCVVKMPPLDTYLPNGEKADYNNKAQVKKAAKWTMQKAHELSGRHGYVADDIDLMIQAYLKGETFEPTEQEPVKRKQKAPLTKQPQTPIHLMKKQPAHEQGSVQTALKEQGTQEKEKKTAEQQAATEDNRETDKQAPGSLMQHLMQQQNSNHPDE